VNDAADEVGMVAPDRGFTYGSVRRKTRSSGPIDDRLCGRLFTACAALMTRALQHLAVLLLAHALAALLDQ